ncbi:MAG: transglycosylase SLT domain-containing protein [Terriglobia bacterium]
MPRTALFLLLISAAAVAGPVSHSASGVSPDAMTLAKVSPRLRSLAVRAKARRGWRALRRYAASTRNTESGCLAYFTLGYREYMAAENGLAADDLKRAARAACPLEDFAEYYQASADAQINHAAAGITVLTGFPERHPRSIYRLRAVNLLASLLIKTGHPEGALAVLNSEPAAQRNPSSLLLAAKADEALPDDEAAASAYQHIYNAFPAEPEARSAAAALDRLRLRMGPRYHEPSLAAQTARAGKLFARGLYQESLSAYDSLLLGAPKSQLAGGWRIGRARCFIRMRRYSDAVTALAHAEPAEPDLDARRLALEVHADELGGDEPAMVTTLNEIYKKYPHSPSYGDALAYAGGYFARQGFWQTAVRYYLPLSQTFPNGRYAVEASWRVAWYAVLAGNMDGAKTALTGFLRRYPRSSRAPAALYWLANIEQQQSSPRTAQGIDRLLAARYTNTYYGLKARQRMTGPRARERHVGRQFNSATGAVALAAMGIVIPERPEPPLSACGSIAPRASLMLPYETLGALSLRALGEQYLVDLIANHPKDPRLYLAAARLRGSNHDTASAIFDAKRAVPDYDEYSFAALPREAWRLLYPDPYWNLVRRYARANHLNPYLVMGLIRQESAFNPRATSSTRARGLMQMEPYTANSRVRGRARRRRVTRALYSPAFNIRVSCRYLRGLLTSFDGNLPETLASYNAGDIRVRQWIANSKVYDPDEFLETIPFTDTRAYVEEVLRDSLIYRSVLTGRARFSRCR